MESIIPYQILPYDFYIGFYLYDADVESLTGQTTKWKNAMEGMYILFTRRERERERERDLY